MDAARDEFADWYRASWPRLVAAMTVVCGSRAIAEDVAAEAFTRAYLHWSEVQGMASRDGWVHQVALNEARSLWRRGRTAARWLARQPAPEVAPPPDVDPELWAAVQALPDRTRTAVALRYLGGLSQPQIAQVLGVAVGTVASRLHAGRRALSISLASRQEEIDHARRR